MYCRISISFTRGFRKFVSISHSHQPIFTILGQMRDGEENKSTIFLVAMWQTSGSGLTQKSGFEFGITFAIFEDIGVG